MNIIKVILPISILALSTFSLINESMNLTPILFLLLGAMLLMMGAEEIKQEKKTAGYLFIDYYRFL